MNVLSIKKDPFLQERLMGPEIWTYRKRRRRMEWHIYENFTYMYTKMWKRRKKKQPLEDYFFLIKEKKVWMWWFVVLSFWLFYSCLVKLPLHHDGPFCISLFLLSLYRNQKKLLYRFFSFLFVSGVKLYLPL